MLYEFGENDIFHNQIKTHPKVGFIVSEQQIHRKGSRSIPGSYGNNVTHVPSGYLNLYEMNVDREELIYPFITKDGTLMSFKSVSLTDFQSFSYGDEITGSYPLSGSISFDKYLIDQTRPQVSALKNTLNHYRYMSPHFEFNSSLHDYSSDGLLVLNIPSIFYGSSIKKGTIDVRYYTDGDVTSQLIDSKQNGELIDADDGSVKGVVLYTEGFMILYDNMNPMDDGDFDDNEALTVDFEGTNYVPTLTMLCHAPKGELNHSNNPTYREYGQSYAAFTNSIEYVENDSLSIKNTVKSPYIDPEASFRKQTWISSIGIYDKDKNLIAIAKVARPLLKTEAREFTFKLRVDF